MSASSLVQFFALRVPDGRLTQVLERIKMVFASIFSKEILDGQILGEIVLTGGVSTAVPHKLQRPYNGYIVIKQNAHGTTFDDKGPNSDVGNYIYINASATMTVDLWVF